MENMIVFGKITWQKSKLGFLNIKDPEIVPSPTKTKAILFLSDKSCKPYNDLHHVFVLPRKKGGLKLET